jgi:hypothetical protein
MSGKNCITDPRLAMLYLEDYLGDDLASAAGAEGSIH